jgi:hypothetical protein
MVEFGRWYWEQNIRGYSESNSKRNVPIGFLYAI